MSNFEATLKIYKDIKDIKEVLDDIDKLRAFYYYRNFEEMKKHIRELSNKYFIERIEWNAVNKSNVPVENDYTQHFINAESFLIVQGFKRLNELRKDWRKILTEEEISFIESMIKPME